MFTPPIIRTCSWSIEMIQLSNPEMKKNTQENFSLKTIFRKKYIFTLRLKKKTIYLEKKISPRVFCSSIFFFLFSCCMNFLKFSLKKHCFLHRFSSKNMCLKSDDFIVIRIDKETHSEQVPALNNIGWWKDWLIRSLLFLSTSCLIKLIVLCKLGTNVNYLVFLMCSWFDQTLKKFHLSFLDWQQSAL